MACKESQTPVNITTTSTLGNYADITEFDINAGPPGDNPTDCGTNIDEMARWWRKHGMRDADGKLHKIFGYCELEAGNLDQLWVASFVSSVGVGMGFNLPDSAMEQTQNGMPWDVVPGATIVGGHYCSELWAGRRELGVGVSWGMPQPFSPKFYSTYSNQGIMVVDEECLIKMKTIDGIDDAALRDDIIQVTKVR